MATKTPTKRKGNPAKRAEQLRISQIGDFKKRMGGIMELPSGAVVRLKNPGGLQAFIGEQSADIPNPLMNIIQESLDKGQAPSIKKFTNASGGVDPEMMDAMNRMLEQALVKTIVEPKVKPRLTQADVDQWNTENPDDLVEDLEELRDENVLYADEFPDADKQFIFQWVTGAVKDLETFRQKQQQGLGDLEAIASSEADTE